eukprot:6455422-Amphidinium_carterae.5
MVYIASWLCACLGCCCGVEMPRESFILVVADNQLLPCSFPEHGICIQRSVTEFFVGSHPKKSKRSSKCRDLHELRVVGRRSVCQFIGKSLADTLEPAMKECTWTHPDNGTETSVDFGSAPRLHE